MAKPFSALSSIVTIVVFFALIAVAAILYGGNSEQKARVEQNFFWRNAKVAMDSVWIAVQGVADMGMGKSYEGQASTTPIVQATEEVGTFQQIGADIKDEWNKDGGIKLETVSEVNLDKIWEWRKNAAGAEVVFKDKDGEEHIVSLPFKFLAE
ncbi:MAG: hypothetical protein WC719_04240 [Patescibacteria group bacterium]|jgi:hypothetical protein